MPAYDDWPGRRDDRWATRFRLFYCWAPFLPLLDSSRPWLVLALCKHVRCSSLCDLEVKEPLSAVQWPVVLNFQAGRSSAILKNWNCMFIKSFCLIQGSLFWLQLRCNWYSRLTRLFSSLTMDADETAIIRSLSFISRKKKTSNLYLDL